MRKEHNDLGVSPVIAVILMVAITVVLSGVVFLWATSFSNDSGNGLDLTTLKVKLFDDPAGDRLRIEVMKGQVIWGESRIFVSTMDGTTYNADLSGAPEKSRAGDSVEFDSLTDTGGNPAAFDIDIGENVYVKVVNRTSNKEIWVDEVNPGIDL